MQFGVSESVAHWGKYKSRACAVVHGDEETSYGDLNSRVDKLAREVCARVTTTDRVAVAVKSKYMFLVGLLGVLRAGKSAVILNTGLPDHVLATNLNDADVTAIIYDVPNRKCISLRNGTRTIEGLDMEYILGSTQPTTGARLDINCWPTRGPTDEWGVLYSSGTTGIPKGIERDHNSMVTELIGWCLELGLSGKTTFFIGRPVYYTGGLVLALSTLLVGGCVILNDYQNDNDPSEAWADYQRVSEKRALSWTFFVPDQLRCFVKICQSASSPPKGAEKILVMGAPISGQEKLAAKQFLQSGIVESWGNSESLGTITDPDDLETRPDSVGRPFLTDELYVVDDKCHNVGPGQLGRIAGGQEAGFCKYCNRPEATDFAKRNSLIVSEDIGYTDADGYFYVCGRHQDCIVRDGATILKPSIEAKLRRSAFASECCISAASGDDGPVKLTAVIVPGEAGRIQEADLLRELNALLDASERLDAIMYIESMPRVPSGKIDRIALERLLAKP